MLERALVLGAAGATLLLAGALTFDVKAIKKMADARQLLRRISAATGRVAVTTALVLGVATSVVDDGEDPSSGDAGEARGSGSSRQGEQRSWESGAPRRPSDLTEQIVITTTFKSLARPNGLSPDHAGSGLK